MRIILYLTAFFLCSLNQEKDWLIRKFYDLVQSETKVNHSNIINFGSIQTYSKKRYWSTFHILCSSA